ncbi:torsin-1A-like [Anneissia japonica]|uniref:torsin-1A-like n=1 Tax=Anneissia japonica TaxID=1529436 RepID=UPI0014256641|nr:torsin-1A-like [Anneissia japonica]XP_033119221.1 torsin-1A-like [Anneissia japonica]
MKLQIIGPMMLLLVLNTIFTNILPVIGKDYVFEKRTFWNKLITPTSWCFRKECCTDTYITPNITKLKEEFNKKVYGQPLVYEVLPKAINAHFENVPNKALVLSFHGRTGGGKNFVSQIIAESLFQKGMDSKFVHLFIPELHFPHKHQITRYKDQLQNWIRGNMSTCPTQLFIFDEMQSLLPELLDVIKPFIDYYNHKINGVDYRRAIFIFLSSTSGNNITSVAFKAFKNGRKREDVTLREFENGIRLSSYKHQGSGLWHSKLIEHHLISHFVPFLPLERQHVRKCIQEEMRKRGMPKCPETEDEVLEYLNFGPDEAPIYAAKGCKNIHEKLNLVSNW